MLSTFYTLRTIVRPTKFVVRKPRPKFNDELAKKFCSRSLKSCGNNFSFHFYRVTLHWCEVLIAILSVHPSVTFRCSKKQQPHEKQTGAKRPQSGSKRPVSGRNVQVAKRPRGETSCYRRNESGSWFQRRGDAYLNKRSVIFIFS